MELPVSLQVQTTFLRFDIITETGTYVGGVHVPLKVHASINYFRINFYLELIIFAFYVCSLYFQAEAITSEGLFL